MPWTICGCLVEAGWVPAAIPRRLRRLKVGGVDPDGESGLNSLYAGYNAFPNHVHQPMRRMPS